MNCSQLVLSWATPLTMLVISCTRIIYPWSNSVADILLSALSGFERLYNRVYSYTVIVTLSILRLYVQTLKPSIRTGLNICALFSTSCWNQTMQFRKQPQSRLAFMKSYINYVIGEKIAQSAFRGLHRHQAQSCFAFCCDLLYRSSEVIESLKQDETKIDDVGEDNDAEVTEDLKQTKDQAAKGNIK